MGRKAKRCGQCAHFLGMGDWDLCCKKQARRLTYEMNDACGEFEQNAKCINVSAMVGGFYCSICGVYGLDMLVRDMTCPKCGNEIEGALFGGSLGWREDEAG